MRVLCGIQICQNTYLTILKSTYKFERQNFRHGHRNAPKLCTHVRIDNLTLKKWTHPTPGG